MAQYSNLPPAAKPSNSDTVSAMNNYYSNTIELNPTVLAAMTGYFTNRGFGEVSAESITLTIMKQAHVDGYNPMKILDTLKGLSNVQLSGLVSELLNYNRFKSSSLGYSRGFTPNPQIQRNIVDGYYNFSVSNSSVNTRFALFDENGQLITNELGQILTTE
jgi:hypothetical protein